jgi:hypothetical protein
MSGLTERALDEHGVREEPLLRKAFKPSELARRVRAALDAPAEQADRAC